MNSPLEQFKALLAGRRHAKVTEDHVQSVLSFRRGREALLGPHLFCDPAWDILLELYAARLGKRAISRDDLAKAIGISHSVISRWVRALADADLVVESSGPSGEGSPSIALTEIGAGKLTQLVNQWSAAFLTI